MRYVLARDSDARARGLRVSAIRTRALRCFALTVALVMFFMLLPTRSYASGDVGEWSRVWFHSSVDDGEQYIVGAYNKFDAAAYICGYTRQDVLSWDLPVLNKLSTQQTAFLDLANSLQNVTPWNDESLKASLEEYFGSSLWFDMGQIAVGTGGIGVNLNGINSFQIKYWEDNKPSDMPVWAVNTTSSDVGAAREALQQILAGGGSGGGSGGNVVDGRTITFNMQVQSTVYKTNQTPRTFSISGTTYTFGTPVPNGATLVDNFVMNLTMQEDLLDGYDYVCYVTNNNVNSLTFNVYVLKRGHYTITDATYDGTRYTQTYKVITTDEPYYGGVIGTTINIGNSNISVVNGTIVINDTYPHLLNSSRPAGTIYIPINYNQYSTNLPYAISSQSGGDEPTGPGDWPDDPSPETPVNPTVPTPTPPELPTPTNPIIPPIVSTEATTNVTDPTSWTDYTPWLQKILQQLRNLNDEIAEHCVHIQQQIVDQATNLINELNDAVERLIDYSDELLRALTRYLEQLANWLADELEYNDSSVLYWLRNIYTRLGKLIRSNGPSVLEPDPTESFDFWAWLWGLITNVIGDFIGDFVGDVGGLIDALKDKFPFSIPWDIAAMLALLDANRVTPVWVINIPAVNGWWGAYSYRIDLQPFDSVAGSCRAMFNIVWAFVLIMKTNWMLMIMGDATSLGERFANRVGRGTE